MTQRRVEDWCVSEGDTVVLSDYHMCRYDALLGVLLCVGDDAPALVLGKDLCRTVVALPSNTHWLDCFLFAGTSTFVVLSRDVLLCLDYRTPTTTTAAAATCALTAASRRTRFTCLHVPQGLTRGALGCCDGRVCYFAVQSSNSGEATRPPAALSWAVKETNMLALCGPYMSSTSSNNSSSRPPAATTAAAQHDDADDQEQDEEAACFARDGAVLALDTYPDNPNALIAVLAGVRGVCKVYIDEGRVSCFFSANAALAAAEASAVVVTSSATSASSSASHVSAAAARQAEAALATCRVTPGGAYVVAATQSGRTLLVWDERQKKSKTRIAEVHWVVSLSDLVRGLGDAAAFAQNDYRVGICIARSNSSSSGSDALSMLTSQATPTDKHSDMYVLVHGRRDVVEVVLRVDERRVVRRDTIVAGLHATSATAAMTTTSRQQQQHKDDAGAHTSSTAAADAAATTTLSSLTTAQQHDDYYSIFHVEPCVLSSYWSGAWADVDLDTLIVTSGGGLRPLLAHRNRRVGGVERLAELRELSTTASWATRALALRMPRTVLSALAQQQQQQQQRHYAATAASPSQHGAASTSWERLLRGGDTLLARCAADKPATAAAAAVTTAEGGSGSGGGGGAVSYTHADTATSQLCDELLVLTVTDAAEAVCLSPRTDELFALRTMALRECAPWCALPPPPSPSSSQQLPATRTAADDNDDGVVDEVVVLEQALPSPEVCATAATEVLLRVCVRGDVVSVVKLDVRRGTGAVLLALDRAALQPSSSSSSSSYAAAREATAPLHNDATTSRTTTRCACMVRQAVCLDAVLDVSPVTGRCAVRREAGKCLLLLLDDASVVLVSLTGETDAEGRPCMLHLPASLLPVGARVRSMTACWLPTRDATTATTTTTMTSAAAAAALSLCVVYLFDDRHGVLVWDVSRMRMLSYTSPSYTHAAHTVCVAASPTPLLLPPRLSGDVTRCIVTLPCCRHYSISDATDATTTAAALAPGAYGDVSVCDTLGVPLLTLYLAVGLATRTDDEQQQHQQHDDGARHVVAATGNDDVWCYRHTRDDAWVATMLPASATALSLCVRVTSGSLTWSLRARHVGTSDDDSKDTSSCSSSSDDNDDDAHVSDGVTRVQAVTNSALGDVRVHWSLGTGTLRCIGGGGATAVGDTQRYRLDNMSGSGNDSSSAAVVARQHGHQQQQQRGGGGLSGEVNAMGSVVVDATVLAFVSAHSIALVPLPALLLLSSTASAATASTSNSSGGGGGVTAAAVAQLEAGRRVECVHACLSSGLLLTVTRDDSGWRWLSVLDARTARTRAASYATLDFVDDACVRVVCADVKGTLHVYCIGAQSGVLAHFTVTLSTGDNNGSSNSGSGSSNDDGSGGGSNVCCVGVVRRVRSCFASRRFQPVPGTYREYGRYLPPPPTTKQESGFLRRLMTLPWEEVARKLEADTLRCASDMEQRSRSNTAAAVSSSSSASLPLPRTTTRPPDTTTRHVDANDMPVRTQATRLPSPPQPPQRHDHVAAATLSAAPSTAAAAPQQSRYAQLKAIAEREHVSLSEARRMMSENVRRLQERGERLGELQNKSSELAQSALTFEALARQLQAKQRSGWQW